MIENRYMFKIVDEDAAKTVGFYYTREAAEAAYRRALLTVPEARDSWVLMTLDKDGWPVEAEDATAPAFA